MIFKSYNLEENLDLIDNHKIILFYGENHGLKKEFKEKLRNKTKSQETLYLSQEEIIKNKNTLLNEVTNKSLFNEKKIIFINQASDSIFGIIDEIEELIEEEKIIIFADILDKKSKLRNHFEKSKTIGIVACYQDNDIAIRKIITKKLNGYLGLTNQIINQIIQSTGLDRVKVNNEIDKIICCFTDKKIDPNKIGLLLNNRTNEDFNMLKDEALNGNKINTNRLLADTVFDLESNIYYLNTINQRIVRLNEIESMKPDNPNIESIVSSLKPPVFWKDKPMLIQQSKKWNKNKINYALKKTYDVELKVKSNSAIRKDLLIKNLIIDLCSKANSA